MVGWFEGVGVAVCVGVCVCVLVVPKEKYKVSDSRTGPGWVHGCHQQTGSAVTCWAVDRLESLGGCLNTLMPCNCAYFLACPPPLARLPACSADRNRWRVGLLPFPRAVPPPPPPSEDRTKEILADPRVQAVKERETQVGGEGLGCGSLLR